MHFYQCSFNRLTVKMSTVKVTLFNVTEVFTGSHGKILWYPLVLSAFFENAHMKRFLHELEHQLVSPEPFLVRVNNLQIQIFSRIFKYCGWKKTIKLGRILIQPKLSSVRSKINEEWRKLEVLLSSHWYNEFFYRPSGWRRVKGRMFNWRFEKNPNSRRFSTVNRQFTSEITRHRL